MLLRSFCAKYCIQFGKKECRDQARAFTSLGFPAEHAKESPGSTIHSIFAWKMDGLV